MCASQEARSLIGKEVVRVYRKDAESDQVVLPSPSTLHRKTTRLHESRISLSVGVDHGWSKCAKSAYKHPCACALFNKALKGKQDS